MKRCLVFLVAGTLVGCPVVGASEGDARQLQIVMTTYREAMHCLEKRFTFDQADIDALAAFGRTVAPGMTKEDRDQVWSAVNATPVDRNLSVESVCDMVRMLAPSQINSNAEAGAPQFHWPKKPLEAPF